MGEITIFLTNFINDGHTVSLVFYQFSNINAFYQESYTETVFTLHMCKPSISGDSVNHRLVRRMIMAFMSQWSMTRDKGDIF